MIEPIMRSGPDIAAGYQHVRFRPYRGENYCGPGSLLDIPVLVVGESHYAFEGCVNDENLTCDCIRERQDVLFPFDKAISAAILDKDVLLDEHQALFRSISFYNHHRYLLPTPKDRPTWEQFADPTAIAALREVMGALQPKCVLMFAKMAFNQLPRYDHPDEAATNYIGCHSDDAGWYETVLGNFALTYGLDHPNYWRFAGHDYRYYHPFISRAIDWARRGYRG
jgi:hypothetical protein